ncbi:hypothetical protein ABW20_dc0106234 [Dactylellina cionopaga]|nr:hypothetical protein ABW20_dc0106234 [Dactylellina cionopaga]
MHGFHRIAVLAIWLLCLLFNGAFAVPSDTVPDDAAEAPVEMICHPEKPCYPKNFVPTTTFRPVEPDQVVPPGLHIRLNMGSGGREAKLIDPTEDEGTAVYVEREKKGELPAPVMEYSDLAVVPDQEIVDQASALTGGRGNESDTASPPPVQHIPPSEPDNLKPNPHLSNSDWELFNDAVFLLKGSSPDNPYLHGALERLSEMSHEPEYGVKLVETAVHRLMAIISSSEYPHGIRSDAAITLGNSLQNNAVALFRIKKLLGREAREVVIRPLLEALLNHKEEVLGRRLMFALSRTVRIDQGKYDFKVLGGLETLEKVYTATTDLPLRGKIAAFLQDEFLDADMMELEVAKGGSDKSQKVLKGKEDLSAWCEIFQHDLIERDSNDVDSEVKVLVTLKALKEIYSSKCAAKDGFKEYLKLELSAIQHREQEDADWIKVPLEEAESAFFSSDI